MTWVKLDDGYPEHLKVVGLSDKAFRTDIEGWCYCARTLSDGLIPAAAAKRWTSRPIAELVAASRWHHDVAGYRIHDYLEYNPSREQVLEERSKKQAAGRAGGLASGKARASRSVDSLVEPRPVPDPDPSLNGKAKPRSAVDNRPDHDQSYLASQLEETWGYALGYAAIQKLNNHHGRVAVTNAMRSLHGFPPPEAIRSLYAYIESIAAAEVSA